MSRVKGKIMRTRASLMLCFVIGLSTVALAAEPTVKPTNKPTVKTATSRPATSQPATSKPSEITVPSYRDVTQAVKEQ